MTNKTDKLLPAMICEEEKEELKEAVIVENLDTPDQEPEHNHDKLWKRIPCLGLILTLTRVAMSLIRQAGIKELSGFTPLVYQIYQTMFSLSMSIPWSVAVDKGIFPPNEPRKLNCLLILRGVSSCLVSLGSVFALQNMPIGTFSMVLATRPFFSLVIARIFLSEPCGIPEIVTMALLFSGVIFVVKPPFIFPEDQVADVNHGDYFYLAVGLLLLGNLLSGNVMVILRHLRKQHIATLTASKDIIGTLVLFLVIMVSGVEMSNHSGLDRLKIAAFSVSFIIESNMNLVALKIEEAGKIDLVDRCGNIIIAFSIQIIYFGDIPGLYTFIGVGLVLFAVVVIGTRVLCKSQHGTHADNSKMKR